MSVIERVAKAHYEKYFEGLIPNLELPWKDIPADHKDRLIDAAKAAIAAMPGWEPIATAPKDGRPVLLAVTEDPPGFVAEGYCQTDRDTWYAANTHYTDYTDGQLFPSHWMPLPEAPSPPPAAEQEQT
jgi:hypothetical protein